MQYENYFLNGRLIMRADTPVGWFEGVYRGSMPHDTEGPTLMIPDVPADVAIRVEKGDEAALEEVVERVGRDRYAGRDRRILHIANKIGNSRYGYIPLDAFVKEVNPPVGRVVPEALQRLGSLALHQNRP